MLLSEENMNTVNSTLENLRTKIVRANISGDEQTLSVILKKLNITFIEKEVRNDWKIFLCAGTDISKDDIMKVVTDYKLEDKIEMELDYKKIKGINFSKFRDSQTYKYIIFGQLPHKVKGIGNYGSIISRMQSEQEHYPEVIVLRDSQGKPHLSKNEFYIAIQNIYMNSDYPSQ